MISFNSSLLREKFTIHDPLHESGEPVLALSNRLVVSLKSKEGKNSETFIVRAQNMHSCVRMSGRILSDYYKTGPIMNRQTPYEWEASWNSIVNDYEHTYNPARWVAVYNNGKTIFSDGEYHPFLDVIEKCSIRNKGDYDTTIPIAEDAFRQAGRDVKIDYDANVALVLDLNEKTSKCGVILRSPTRTTTFNCNIVPNKPNQPLNLPQIMAVGAAFLEGVQLGFMVGMNNEKIKLGIIERFSKEENQTKEARRRLSRLSAEIANLENAASVNYRPERPEFPHIVMDAEKLAQKILVPPGEKDQWVE